jgi:hypothetical protein
LLANFWIEVDVPVSYFLLLAAPGDENKAVWAKDGENMDKGDEASDCVLRGWTLGLGQYSKCVL